MRYADPTRDLAGGEPSQTHLFHQCDGVFNKERARVALLSGGSSW